MNSKEISELLRDHGIKPSFTRIQIYKYLYDNRNHPTVDNIYSSLVDDIPTLSKTTIYNTLDILINVKLVKSLNLDENEKRYEVVIHSHSHFKCQECEEIYDIPYEEIKLLPKGYEDFKINEKQIFLKGICKYCLDS